MKRSQLLGLVHAFRDFTPKQENETPWMEFSAEEIEEREKLVLREFGFDAFDLFRPVRRPLSVARELVETTTTLSSSGLLDDLACPICMGICKEVMVVKDCSHRFCAECIQKWLRQGHQVCPQCRMRIGSRRALRHDHIFDAVIERLFPDVEGFEQRRAEILMEVSRKMQPQEIPPEPDRRGMGKKRRTPRKQQVVSSPSSGIKSSSNPESLGTEDEDAEEDDDEEEEDEELEDDEDEEVTDDEAPRRRGRGKGQDTMTEDLSRGLPSYEVFLICQNHDLPPALLSMVRELSKRPLKFPINCSSRDVGAFLTDRLTRDVLGPVDPHRVLHEVSFATREGILQPATAAVPLAHLCRTITESDGPTAIRYYLSPLLLHATDKPPPPPPLVYG